MSRIRERIETENNKKTIEPIRCVKSDTKSEKRTKATGKDHDMTYWKQKRNRPSQGKEDYLSPFASSEPASEESRIALEDRKSTLLQEMAWWQEELEVNSPSWRTGGEPRIEEIQRELADVDQKIGFCERQKEWNRLAESPRSRAPARKLGESRPKVFDIGEGTTCERAEAAGSSQSENDFAPVYDQEGGLIGAEETTENAHAWNDEGASTTS